MTFFRLLCALPILALIGCASKQSAPPPQAAAAEPANPPSPVPVITVPQGTLLRVRLAETLDTKRNRSGDRFSATLASPVSVNGQTVIPKGARFSGRIDTSAQSGRLKGRAMMNLSLDAFEL